MHERLTFTQFCDRLIEDGVYIGPDNHLYRKDGRALSRMTTNGYYMVRKMYDGINYYFVEHRVIWYFHNGSIDENLVINHKDFDRANNDINNLELVTQSENTLYSLRNGRCHVACGETHARAELTNDEVRAIRLMAKNGWKQKDLAVLFNVKNKNLISRVVTRARYGKVEDASSFMAVYPVIVAKTHPDGPWRDQLLNASLGLCGECGEAVDLVKKAVFQGHDLDVTHLILELGDVMYYLCWLCLLLDLNFYEICLANMEKLNARYPDGFSVERSVNRKEGDV